MKPFSGDSHYGKLRTFNGPWSKPYSNVVPWKYLTRLKKTGNYYRYKLGCLSLSPAPLWG